MSHDSASRMQIGRRGQLPITNHQSPIGKVVIIGGGITGLAAAYRLVEERANQARDIEVILLESTDRAGGVIRTEYRDGFIIEHGPDSFITSKPGAINLCERLGIDDQLIRTNESNRTTYVVKNGRLVPLPEGFQMLAPTRLLPFATSPFLSPMGKLRLGMDLVLPKGPSRADESLASFVRRRFGKEVLDRVAQPMIGGIYTADPENLSLRATMPRFLDMEEKHRSVIQGLLSERNHTKTPRDAGARYSLFVSFAQGMQTFVDAILKKIGDCIRPNSVVKKVNQSGNQWNIELSDGTSMLADRVILAVPAYAGAKIIEDVDAELSQMLGGIPYASSVVVNMAYRDEVKNPPIDGFGFVVPAIEKRYIIACTLSSVKFANRAPASHMLSRCFMGGSLQPQMCDLDDKTLTTMCRREMSGLLGITGEPLFVSVQRHPRSMPQYEVGHIDRVAKIRERVTQWPGLAIAGNAFDGVGIPDCIRSGEDAACVDYQ